MRSRQIFAALEKADKIQGMIHEVHGRIADLRSHLYAYDNSPDPFHPVKLFNTREQLVEKLVWNNVLKARLQQYFDSSIMPLCIDVMQRSLPASNVVQIAEMHALSMNTAL